MKSYKKTFDKKHKVTRILLSDYLALKRISQAAGVSMAEALHKLITGQDHKDKAPAPEPVTKPVTKPISQPAFRVKAPVSGIRVTAPVSGVKVTAPVSIATNGSKVAAFRITTREVKYD